MAKSTIKFELRGQDRQLALMAQRQAVEQGFNYDLSETVKQLFTYWLYQKYQQVRGEEEQNGSTGDIGGGSGQAQASDNSNQLEEAAP